MPGKAHTVLRKNQDAALTGDPKAECMGERRAERTRPLLWTVWDSTGSLWKASGELALVGTGVEVWRRNPSPVRKRDGEEEGSNACEGRSTELIPV